MCSAAIPHLQGLGFDPELGLLSIPLHVRSVLVWVVFQFFGYFPPLKHMPVGGIAFPNST